MRKSILKKSKLDEVPEYRKENEDPVMPWMIRYRRTIKPKSKRCPTRPDTAYLDYICKSENKTTGKQLLTKIMCSFDSKRSYESMILSLLHAGISSTCIDTSRDSISDIRNLLKLIDEATTQFNVKTGLCYPFQIAFEVGFKLRTGNLDQLTKGKVFLKENDVITLTAKEEYKNHCNNKYIYVNYDIFTYINPTNMVYLNYNEIVLLVSEVKGTRCKCIVKKGGKLTNNCLVHVPKVPRPRFENKDIDDIMRFAVQQEIRLFVVQCTQGPEDIERIRIELGNSGKLSIIWAKIEDSIGVENIEEILEVADGIIISRVDLLTEISIHRMCAIQKCLIGKCNKFGKPVYLSHFLSSLAKSKRPAAEEIMDVTNAILDGADGFLLRDDIIYGVDPISAVKVLTKACIQAEATIYQKGIFNNLILDLPSQMSATNAIAMSAVQSAKKCNGVCIIALTVSGRTAKLISQYRPSCPVLAVTRHTSVAKRLIVCRGLIVLHYIAPTVPVFIHDVEKRIMFAMTYGKYEGLIKAGDKVILVTSWKEGSGFTNTVRIVFASQYLCPETN